MGSRIHNPPLPVPLSPPRFCAAPPRFHFSCLSHYRLSSRPTPLRFLLPQKAAVQATWNDASKLPGLLQFSPPRSLVEAAAKVYMVRRRHSSCKLRLCFFIPLPAPFCMKIPMKHPSGSHCLRVNRIDVFYGLQYTLVTALHYQTHQYRPLDPHSSPQTSCQRVPSSPRPW